MVNRAMHFGTSWGAGAWTPASLGTDLIDYWDAGAGKTLSGANVLTWTGQGPNAYVLGLNTLAGSAAPVSPTYSATSYGGLPGISFAGLNATSDGQYLSTTVGAVAFGSSVCSFFISAQLASSSDAFAAFIAFDNNNNAPGNIDAIMPIARAAGGEAFRCHQGGNVGATIPLTYDTPTRMGQVFDNVNNTPYLNNVAQTTTAFSFTLAANGRISVGSANDASGGRNVNGIIHRIVVTKSVVSAGDRINIDTWLQA